MVHGLSCPTARGGLPGPGIKPVSPTVAGRFFTTEPPGNPLFAVLNIKCHLIFVIWLILIKIQWEEKNQNALRVRENSGMLVILVD